jgi:hypothetical protein
MPLDEVGAGILVSSKAPANELPVVRRHRRSPGPFFDETNVGCNRFHGPVKPGARINVIYLQEARYGR